MLLTRCVNSIFHNNCLSILRHKMDKILFILLILQLYCFSYSKEECKWLQTLTYEAAEDLNIEFGAKIQKHDLLVIDIIYKDKKNDRITMSTEKSSIHTNNGEHFEETSINSILNEGLHNMSISVGNNSLNVTCQTSEMLPVRFIPQSRMKTVKVSSANLKICEESCNIEKRLEKNINTEDRIGITIFTTTTFPITFEIRNSTGDGIVGSFTIKPGDCFENILDENIPCDFINPGWNKLNVFANRTSIAINNNSVLQRDVPLKTIFISGNYLVDCKKGNPKWKISNHKEIRIPITYGQEIDFVLTSNVAFSPVFNIDGNNLTLNWNNGLKFGSGKSLQPKSYHISVEATTHMIMIYDKKKSEQKLLLDINVEEWPGFITVGSLNGDYWITLSVPDPNQQNTEHPLVTGTTLVTGLPAPGTPVPGLSTSTKIVIVVLAVIIIAIIAVVSVFAWKEVKMKKMKKEQDNIESQNEKLLPKSSPAALKEYEDQKKSNEKLKQELKNKEAKFKLQEDDIQALKKKVELGKQNLAQYAKLPDMEQELKQRMEAFNQEMKLKHEQTIADMQNSYQQQLQEIENKLLQQQTKLKENSDKRIKELELELQVERGAKLTAQQDSQQMREFRDQLQQQMLKNCDVNLLNAPTLDQFYLMLTRMVSQSRPDEPPEELHKKLPPLPPGTEWRELDIDPYNITYDKLKNTMHKMKSDLEMAESILSTTVSSNKYEEKILRMKSHKETEYDKDMEDFHSVIMQEKSNLMKIEVPIDDCCNIMLTSTILDLKDENFNELVKLNKYEFLKRFNISGIPIFSSLREAAMINPWILSIQRILKSPYTLVSQVVLENMSTSNPESIDEQNKGVRLQENEEDTCFNAIIPVFPPNVASQMRHVMRTNIYAMCCTFAILKNPTIIDYNVHMAALGIAWVRMLYENPIKPRPEYVQYRMKCIEATAAQYSDRPSFANYCDLLKDCTNQAIMTESTVEIVGNTLKCESLVKPMFILHLVIQAEQITDKTIIKNIVKTILIEYIGRCLSKKVNHVKFDNDSTKQTMYSDFFTESLTDHEYETDDVKRYAEDTKAKLAGNEENLLKLFYYKDQCQKAANRSAKEVIKLYNYELFTAVPIKLNKKMINQLRNVSACGDLSWATLETFSKEVGLSKSDVEDLFSDENVFRYVSHGFKYTSSRERLGTTLLEYNECVEEIREKVNKNHSKVMIKSLFRKLVDEMVNSWLCTYNEAHADIVEPMTKSQIIQEAKIRGVNVDDENFDKIYKYYRPAVGLLRNACQSPCCPWFLKPMKTYNEHAATERRHEDFPHGLNIAIEKSCTADIKTISNNIVAGKYRRSDKATTHERLAKLDLVHLKNSYKQMDVK